MTFLVPDHHACAPVHLRKLKLIVGAQATDASLPIGHDDNFTRGADKQEGVRWTNHQGLAMTTTPPTSPNHNGSSNDANSASRSFGTLLSANTPSRSAKKAIVRKSRSSGRRETEDAARDRTDDLDAGDVSYWVVFEAGKIGLVLDPGSSLTSPSSSTIAAARTPHCVVQSLVPGGVASTYSCIQVGDYIQRVNDETVTSYDHALRLLKVDGTRNVVFGRPAVAGAAEEGDVNASPNKVAPQRASKLSRPTASHRKLSSKGRGQPSVPGIVRRNSAPQAALSSPDKSAGSRSSTSTVETSNRSAGVTRVASEPPPQQRDTPRRNRSQSLDPPSGSERRGASVPSSPRASVSTPHVLDLTQAKKSLRFDASAFSSKSSSPAAPRTVTSSPASSKRWYTPATSDEALLDEALMQVPPSNVSLSAASAVFAGRDPSPSPQLLPRPTASSTPQKKKPSMSCPPTPAAPGAAGVPASPPHTPAELRVVALEAELLQEKTNTKILQQDRITKHQLTREMDGLKESNIALRKENQRLEEELAESKQRLQAAEDRSSEPQQELVIARQKVKQLEEEVTLARASMASAEEERSTVTHEIEKIRADRDRMRGIVANQRNQLEEAKSASEQSQEALTRELGAAQELCRKQQLDLSEANAKTERLEAQLADVQREAEQTLAVSEGHVHSSSSQLAALHEQLRAKDEDLQSLQNENCEFESLVIKLSEELDKAATEKSELQRQLSKLEATKQPSPYASENDKLKSRISELQRSYDVLTERLHQQESLYDLEMEKAQLDNERLMAQVHGLQESLEQRAAEDTAVEYFKAQERESALEGQRQQLSDRQTKVEDLESELTSRAKALQAAHIKIASLENANCSYQSDVSQLTSMVDDMAKSKCQLQEKLSAAREELASATEYRNNRIKSLEKLCDQLREKMDKKGKELDAAVSSARKLELAKQQMEGQLVELENRCSDATATKDQEIELVKSQLFACRGEVDDLRTQLAESQWQCDVARKRLSESHGSLNEAKAELSKLRTDVHTLEAAKRDQQRKVDALSAANSELSERVESLHLDLEECDEKYSSVRVSHLNAVHSIEELQAELEDASKELAVAQSEMARYRDQCTHFSRRMAEIVDEVSDSEEAHQKSLAALQDEVSVAYAKRNEMEALLLSVSRGASETEARNTQVRELLDREREKFNAFRLEADACQKESEDLLRNMTQRVKGLEESILKRDHDIKSLQTLLADNEQQLLLAKEEVIASRSRFSAAKEKYAQENEELLAALSVQRTTEEELSNQLALIRTRLAEQQQAFDSTQHILDERIRLYAEDEASKSRQLEELSKAKEVETTALHAYRNELDRAKADITRLNGLLRRAQDESDHFRRKNEEMRQLQAEKTNQLLSRCRRDVESMSNEKQAVEQQLREAKVRMEAAEARLLSAEEGLVAARSERERLIVVKSELFSQVGVERELVKSLRDELEAQCNASLCSSDDEVESPFGGLAKSELRLKCIEFQEELQLHRERVNALQVKAENRNNQLAKVQEDRDLLQTEIDKLIESNTALEGRLEGAMAFKEEALTSENEYRTALSNADEQLRNLEKRLNDLTKERDELSKRIASLESDRQTKSTSFAQESETLNKSLLDLKRQLQSSALRLRSAEDERDKKDTELLSMTIECKALRDKVSTLESHMSYTKDQMHSAQQLNDVLQAEKVGEVGRLTVTVDHLEKERNRLDANSTRLERELEAARVELAEYSKIEESLRQALEKQHQDIVEIEATRDEAVAKLSHASSWVESQSESISTLEQRAAEAERTSGALEIQVTNLQEALKKLEASKKSDTGSNDTRIQDLERMVLVLEKQRDELEESMRSQREEAHHARRNLMETEKLNLAMQSQVDSCKDARDKAKAGMEEARNALEESKSATRRLKDEMDGKRMETDRLKAHVQVLNATISRLNSDLLLHKEAALRAEFRLARTGDYDGEIGRLKNELLRKTSKVESLSEIFRAQQQVLSLSQNLEEQLISFIEDVIRQVDEAFDWVPSSKSRVDSVLMRVEGRTELRCLDLAGLDRVCKKPSVSKTTLWHVIQDVLSKLEAKRRQLFDWKQQRAQRVLSVMTTPEGKCRESAIPDTPTVTETLNNVKRVLSEHLSPLKQENASRLDEKLFQKVIDTLVPQVDALMEDLQSAKDALATQQLLFANLEQISSHQEWDKSRLEKHLQQREAEIQDLQRQVALHKSSAEHELAKIRSQLHESQQLLLQRNSSGCGDSMCSFDGEELNATATNGDEQRQVSLQMARHLGESRLKLVKLKQLRLRRSTEPLKRIVEGNDESS